MGESELLELRTKIPKDIYIKLRFVYVKKGKGAISEVVSEALNQFLNEKNLREYIKP